MPHHFNGTLNLALFIFPDTGVDHGFSVTDFAEAGIPLLACQPLCLFRVLSFLAMKRKVKHGLCLPVGMAQEQPLEAEDAPVQHMGIDTAYQLCLEAGLGQVRIVNYQTLKSTFRVATCTGPPQKTQGHPIDQLAPVDVVLLQETVEHILSTGK